MQAVMDKMAQDFQVHAAKLVKVYQARAGNLVYRLNVGLAQGLWP